MITQFGSQTTGLDVDRPTREDNWASRLAYELALSLLTEDNGQCATIYLYILILKALILLCDIKGRMVIYTERQNDHVKEVERKPRRRESSQEGSCD